MPFVRANGIEVYYESQGQGVPVLFIHGGFGGAESTLYPRPSAISGLLPEDRFRVISFDRRNAGRSQYVLKPFRLEDLADDAYGLLNALGVPRAIVIGDSLGGMVAQQLALDHPDAVSSLVLMETGTHVLERTRQVSAIILLLRLAGPRILFRRFKHRFLNPDWSRPVGPPRTEEALRDLALHHTEFLRTLNALPEPELYRLSLGLIRTYVAYSGRDTAPHLRRLSMPVHVIHGTADSIVPFEKGRALHAAIPGSTLLALPGLDHGLPYYPEAREALREVVESLAVGQGAQPGTAEPVGLEPALRDLITAPGPAGGEA